MANHLQSKPYLNYIRTLPCCHCRSPYTEPHHVTGFGGKMGGKESDIHAVPLCRDCHNTFHLDPVDWNQARWLMNTQNQAARDNVLRITGIS